MGLRFNKAFRLRQCRLHAFADFGRFPDGELVRVFRPLDLGFRGCPGLGSLLGILGSL